MINLEKKFSYKKESRFGILEKDGIFPAMNGLG